MTMLDSPRSKAALLETLRPSVAAERPSGIVDTFIYASGKPDVIPLWVGQGHLPTPDFICDAAIASLKAGETFYTWQRGIPELRAALARYHGRLYRRAFDPENIFVCQGGMQALQLALQALLEPGDEVIVPVPAWANHPASLRLLGVRPVEVPLRFTESELGARSRPAVCSCRSPHEGDHLQYAEQSVGQGDVGS